MNTSKLLVTAHSEACGNLNVLIGEHPSAFVHLPLETYHSKTEKMASGMLRKNVGNFSFVIYGNLRNANYFYEWMNEQNVVEDFLNAVHFSMDKPTSEFLEGKGIPAIQPRENTQPIDILEFMLRISREGKSLYPACENRAEEMPGLLQELDMEVAEFTVCKEVGLTSDMVEEYRNTISKSEPGAVLIHNRSSLARLGAAFPELDLHKIQVLSGSAGVTKLLIDKGIEPDFEADGSWHSIISLVQDTFLPKEP